MSSATSIQSFKAQLAGGGARANQFKVILTFPSWVQTGNVAGQRCQFLISATSLPDQNLGVATVPYRGREVKWAGDRTFSPWSVNVYNDTDFLIRNAFETWSQGIVENDSNKGLTEKDAYQMDAYVYQLDRNDNILKTYKFIDLWPTNIGDISLDYGANDQIEIFPVTFDFLSFETSDVDVSGLINDISANF